MSMKVLLPLGKARISDEVTPFCAFRFPEFTEFLFYLGKTPLLYYLCDDILGKYVVFDTLIRYNETHFFSLIIIGAVWMVFMSF